MQPTMTINMDALRYHIDTYKNFKNQPASWTPQLINVFAAKDLLNEKILDFTRHFGIDVNFGLIAFSDALMQIKEFSVCLAPVQHKIPAARAQQIMTAFAEIQTLVDFLNKQVETLGHNLVNITTFHVGGGVTVAMCSDSCNTKKII